MIDWAERARAHFQERAQEVTDETDETRLSSVSSARVVPVSAEPVLVTRSRYLSRDQAEECHRGGWSDAEIATYLARFDRFRGAGRVDAEELAERLTLRDRQQDDRRLCLECRELDAAGRCRAARRGLIAGAGRELRPIQTLLMRCEGYADPCGRPEDDAPVAAVSRRGSGCQVA